MTDLPIASIPAVPGTAARTSPRAAPARDGTLQPGTSPFQDALALELGLAPDSSMPPRIGVRAAAPKTASNLKPGQDPAQTAAASDAPVAPAGAAIFPFPPALAGTAKANSVLKPKDDAAQTAVVNDAPLSPAGAAMFPFPPALAGASIRPPGASAAAPLSPAFAPAGTEPAGLAPDARKYPPGKTSTAPKVEPELHVASTAADIAASGKFALPAEGAIRRDGALDASLLEQAQVAPAPAIHTGGAAPAPVAPAPVAVLEARVGGSGWDQGLGDKLVWMAGQKQQVAELHLNPPDLGPLKITLTLNHDQASAQFVSAHAAVREAIEAAMPRLREMLADSGITLGNANVSTDAFREQAQPQHQPRAYAGESAAAAVDAGAVSRSELLLRHPLGLVDTFV